MSPPIRLLIHGASGRMGRALLRLVAADARFDVVAAVSRGGNGAHDLAADRLGQAAPFDVAIDFSLPAGFDAILALCVRRGAALVSGTTGLTTTQAVALTDAAAIVPVLHAANFSLGIAVLTELVRRTAAALPQWDCDLLDAHHTLKLDAPSGTALHLGAAIAAGRGNPPHYASVRAGDIVGEHSVQFTGIGERIELIHRATDRDIFARGALAAAARLHGRAPGQYTLAGLLLDADR